MISVVDTDFENRSSIQCEEGGQPSNVVSEWQVSATLSSKAPPPVPLSNLGQSLLFRGRETTNFKGYVTRAERE
jgi:hypothetical protein